MNAKRKLPVYKACLATAVPQRQQALVCLLLTIAAAVVRLWHIETPNRVTWDESHFGRMGAMYLNHTFIRDVHPPLGKLMIALAQHWAGHNGTFTFPSGSLYPEWVDYMWMRAYMSIFGISMVPVAYLTCQKLQMSFEASILAALFVLLDNALCLMTRIVTLDSALLAFTAISVYFVLSIRVSWYSLQSSIILCLSAGISLGLLISVKWAGLLTVGWAGAYMLYITIYELRTCLSLRIILKQIVIRAFSLTLVPVLVYMSVFKVHYMFQTRQGYGEHEMPIQWQAQIAGNRYHHQPGSVAYGAAVKLWTDQIQPIKNALLQSTRRPGIQTVDCQKVITGANWWTIHRQWDHIGLYQNKTVEYVHSGDHVYICNDLANKALTVGNYSDNSYQVLVADNSHDNLGYSGKWIVEIQQNFIPATGSPTDNNTRLIHPISTAFRLRHAQTHCILTIDPQNHAPVKCVLDTTRHSKYQELRVEFNVDLRLGFNNSLTGKVPTHFTTNFIAQQKVMAKINSDLVAVDSDLYDFKASMPWEWPFLTNPMRTSRWDTDIEEQTHPIAVYEIGNPLLWWLSALYCMLSPIRFLWQSCINKRIKATMSMCLWLGWAMHYFPYFFMSRVTYLHHYLPALYFAFLLLAYEIDKLCSRKGIYVLGIATAIVFWQFRKCTYGWEQQSFSDLGNLRWLSSWNIAGSDYDMDFNGF